MFKRLRLIIVALLLVAAGWYVIQRVRESAPPPLLVDSSDFEHRVPPGTTQVLVTARDPETRSVAQVTLWEKKGPKWVAVKGPYTARIGENGFRPAEERTEGDGTTPQGVFPILAAFGGGGAPNTTRIPYTVLRAGDCWISATDDPAYNRWVTREGCGSPNLDLFARGSQENSLLHTALIIGFNTSPRVVPRGSAIFFHLPRRDNANKVIPTTGGIGLGEGSLRAIISRLDERFNPVAILGDRTWISGK